MRVRIESIDLCRPSRVGGTRAPGYRARFQSRGFGGWARFVPAAANGSDLVGREFEVEIDHERITDLLSSGDAAQAAGVLPLAEPGSFLVRGVVREVVSLGESGIGSLAVVAVGDAIFTLDQQDLGGAVLAKGECVAFTAHDVTLWDEAA